MAGVLDAGGPPPPPQQNTQSPSQGVLSAPAMPSPAMVPQQGAGQSPPTPTHGQTVAILRHMDAIQAELEALLKMPEVGKSNVKSKIIDGVTKLVANRIMMPGAAVAQLATVPESPFQQRKWLQQHLLNTVIAKVGAMSHHAAAFGGTPENMIDKTSSPDDHLADMQAAAGHYGRA